MPRQLVDNAPARGFTESLERSRERREHARRVRRRGLRARGGAISLALVVLCMAIAGAGAAVGRSTAVVVKKGDRGPAVAKVQRKLRIPADGVFGSATERAVKRFQRRRGLPADGVIGQATRRALGLGAFGKSGVRRRAPTRQGGTPAPGPGAAPRQPAAPLPAVRRRIAQCESGGDPTAVSRDGRYRGKYQFTRSMWRRMGGHGDPAAAPEWLQDRLALALYRRSGTAPWPNCA